MREPHAAVAARAAFLELFPEAREETKLFTVDPEELGPAFAGHLEDEVGRLAVPKNVETWARAVQWEFNGRISDGRKSSVVQE